MSFVVLMMSKPCFVTSTCAHFQSVSTRQGNMFRKMRLCCVSAKTLGICGAFELLQQLLLLYFPVVCGKPPRTCLVSLAPCSAVLPVRTCLFQQLCCAHARVGSVRVFFGRCQEVRLVKQGSRCSIGALTSASDGLAYLQAERVADRSIIAKGNHRDWRL